MRKQCVYNVKRNKSPFSKMLLVSTLMAKHGTFHTVHISKNAVDSILSTHAQCLPGKLFWQIDVISVFIVGCMWFRVSCSSCQTRAGNEQYVILVTAFLDRGETGYSGLMLAGWLAGRGHGMTKGTCWTGRSHSPEKDIKFPVLFSEQINVILSFIQLWDKCLYNKVRPLMWNCYHLRKGLQRTCS